MAITWAQRLKRLFGIDTETRLAGGGHFLGGSSAEGRATLGIACSVGLALFIAALNSVDHEVIPTLVAYMILGAIVAIPCSVWSNRQLAQSK